MPRQSNRHNRQDVLLRTTPQDRPNILDLTGTGGGGAGACGCSCNSAGGVADCTRCPFDAPQALQFRIPGVDPLWQGSIVSLTHDEGCCWESDDQDRECGEEYAPDQYFWQLCLEDDCCGNVQAVLKYTRRSGSACDDLEIVYRSIFPWRCLCPNALYLDEQRSTGLQGIVADLPCSICVEPEPITCQGLSGMLEVYEITAAAGADDFGAMDGLCEFPIPVRWNGQFWQSEECNQGDPGQVPARHLELHCGFEPWPIELVIVERSYLIVGANPQLHKCWRWRENEFVPATGGLFDFAQCGTSTGAGAGRDPLTLQAPT